MKKKMGKRYYEFNKKKDNSVLYGMIASLALLVFYLGIVSIFQGIEFALMNLRSLWYLIFPLAAGFGTQVGLFFSIRHTAQVTAMVGSTGAVSGGSMLACCSHFLLNTLPFAGFAGLATILVQYQAWFLGVGILSNVLGIGFMIRHKNRMKGGNCHI
jgi:hypothetical protein